MIYPNVFSEHSSLTSSRKILHRTMTASVCDDLRKRILSGELRGGDSLRQEAVADELGISRIPVREALIQLEGEGLVSILPHRGAVVTETSVTEIEEVYEMRARLEPYLLARSAPLLEEDDFKVIDATLAEFRAEISACHVQLWGELNTRLHRQLYSRAPQGRLAQTVNVLLGVSDRYTRIRLMLDDGAQRANGEHSSIVEACRTGRIQLATRLLEDHIRANGVSLVEHYRQAEAAEAASVRSAIPGDHPH